MLCVLECVSGVSSMRSISECVLGVSNMRCIFACVLRVSNVRCVSASRRQVVLYSNTSRHALTQSLKHAMHAYSHTHMHTCTHTQIHKHGCMYTGRCVRSQVHHRRSAIRLGQAYTLLYTRFLLAKNWHDSDKQVSCGCESQRRWGRAHGKRRGLGVRRRRGARPPWVGKCLLDTN